MLHLNVVLVVSNANLLFRSDHEDIEMIPVDQFYSEAPESISKPVCVFLHGLSA